MTYFTLINLYNCSSFDLVLVSVTLYFLSDDEQTLERKFKTKVFTQYSVQSHCV